MAVQHREHRWVWLASLSVCTSSFLACADDDAGRFGPDGTNLAENRIEPRSLVLSTHDITLSVNESLKLTAAYQAPGAMEASDVTAEVQWLSADPSIAWARPGEHGVILGVYPGTTEISARYAGNTDSVRVTITADGLRQIELQPQQLELPSGTSAALRAIGVFSQDARRDITALATWQSDNAAIAATDGASVRGLARGTAVISASLGDARATLEVRVTDAKLLELEVLREREQMEVNSTQQLRARGHFSDGASVDVTDLALWTSDDGNLARVDENGLVQARSTGEVGIWARYLGLASQTSVVITSLGQADPE